MNDAWLNETVKINTEVLQSTLSLYFENVKSDCDTSHTLTKKEEKYFIKLFTSKLLDCKKCCKKCPERIITYRDIFHILYEVYEKVDEHNNGTAECFLIIAFFYEHHTKQSVFRKSIAGDEVGKINIQ
jgi:ferredoxin